MNTYVGREASRVGFVLFVALLVAVLGLYVIAFRPAVVGDMVVFKARFEDSGGLRKGAPVWIGGVEVGAVTDVGFAFDADVKHIEVTLAVGRRFAGRVGADSVCRVRTRGLLGERIVTIAAGSAAADPVAPGGEIRTEEPSDIETAIATAGEGVGSTAAEAALLLRELRALVEDAKSEESILGKLIYSDQFYTDTFQRIDDIVAEFKRELHELNDVLRKELTELRASLSGSVDRAQEEFATTAHAIRETSGEVNRQLQTLGALMATVGEGKGAAGMLLADEEFAGSFKRAVAAIESSSVRLASILGKVDDGEGTAGMLVSDSEAYMSLRDLFTGVQQSWLVRSALLEAEASGRRLRIERWERKGASP